MDDSKAILLLMLLVCALFITFSVLAFVGVFG